ncbi:unnamed protein product [Acanthoscelides obtectus]|uniref:Regulatory protein zeste n=1 Tax=Acanthoscelides obtectus TaxID=200917 RepID=A0A9P0LKZ4_ACAOB|nr:unnamed protein product [Acanthoscelides obtectus]CAK1651364.1 hypothetical protein AOBTE_LOCUS17223 [Acanthoscelides obtectus]
MSVAEKRKRGANFTTSETRVHLSIITEFKGIMENTKNDGVSVQEKNQAWSKITAKFNAACLEGRHRTMDSLKKLFDNKKGSCGKRSQKYLKLVVGLHRKLVITESSQLMEDGNQENNSRSMEQLVDISMAERVRFEKTCFSTIEAIYQ